MRYRLRTLLIVLALGPPLIWAIWLAWQTMQSDAPAEYNVGHVLQLDVF